MLVIPGLPVPWARTLLLFLSVTILLPSSAVGQQMVLIPGSTFKMGSEEGDADERPVHRVTLRAFLIDRHEVTRGQHRRCVAAGVCPLPRNYPRLSGARMPVVGVTWHEARAYCRWVKKRLPSEAEWELAARGTEGRPYPWGDDLDCKRANFGNYAGAGRCAQANPGQVVPVETRAGGNTPRGVADLGGNVWEWVEDSYSPYPKRIRGGKPRRPPRGGRQLKVVRGGSCCSYFIMPRAANRLAFPARYRDRDIGFRCARDTKRLQKKR